MKLVVWKNYLGGQILYRSLVHPIKNGVINNCGLFKSSELKSVWQRGQGKTVSGTFDAIYWWTQSKQKECSHFCESFSF